MVRTAIRRGWLDGPIEADRRAVLMGALERLLNAPGLPAPVLI
jgi:hypothetical protein